MCNAFVLALHNLRMMIVWCPVYCENTRLRATRAHPTKQSNHSAIMQRPKVSEFLASRIIFTAISRFMEYGCKGLSTILVSAWD